MKVISKKKDFGLIANSFGVDIICGKSFNLDVKLFPATITYEKVTFMDKLLSFITLGLRQPKLKIAKGLCFKVPFNKGNKLIYLTTPFNILTPKYIFNFCNIISHKINNDIIEFFVYYSDKSAFKDK